MRLLYVIILSPVVGSLVSFDGTQGTSTYRYVHKILEIKADVSFPYFSRPLQLDELTRSNPLLIPGNS